MKEKIIIVALLLLAIYLYYQNRKLAQQPASSDNSTPLTVFDLGEGKDELIADRDTSIREKKEMEQEVLSLSNKLRNKQQETTRKEQEIERVKKEKSQVEIALNAKIKDLKKDLEEQKQKYSRREQLLDEEQLENKKLLEEKEQLEQRIGELTRSESSMPGEFPNDELIKEHQDELRAINLLFDPAAKDYEKIDFNGLYEMLKGISERERESKRREQQPIYSRQRKQKK